MMDKMGSMFLALFVIHQFEVLHNNALEKIIGLWRAIPQIYEDLVDCFIFGLEIFSPYCHSPSFMMSTTLNFNKAVNPYTRAVESSNAKYKIDEHTLFNWKI